MNKTRLDLAGLEKLKKQLQDNARSTADIGIFSSHNARDDGETNASVGFDMEFGVYQETETTPAQEQARGRGHMTWTGVPQRSFLRMPLEGVYQFYIVKYRSQLTKDLIEKGPMAVLQRLGQLGVITVDQAFTSKGFGSWPDNSPRTIAWKGSDRPLLDSEQLRDSVSFRVTKATV